MRVCEVKRLGAIFFGLTKAEIEGPSRARKYAWPRQVTMALCRRYCDRASLPQIGLAFNRDHTTVLHAVKAVEAQWDVRGMAADISILCAQIEAGAISVFSPWALRERALEQPFRIAVVQLAAPQPSYSRALAMAGADFSKRMAVNPSPAIATWPGPRILLLRGPGAFSAAQVAA